MLLKDIVWSEIASYESDVEIKIETKYENVQDCVDRQKQFLEGLDKQFGVLADLLGDSSTVSTIDGDSDYLSKSLRRSFEDSLAGMNFRI